MKMLGSYPVSVLKNGKATQYRAQVISTAAMYQCYKFEFDAIALLAGVTLEYQCCACLKKKLNCDYAYDINVQG